MKAYYFCRDRIELGAPESCRGCILAGKARFRAATGLAARVGILSRRK